MALMFDNCDNVILSLDNQKSVPAPFLTKTYHLVDDPTTNHIVSWGEDDSTFVVWRPPELARDILPKFFKHNNFSSFVRQLNTYGFRKIVPDKWEFANQNFKKGEKHLLCEIHRRKTNHHGNVAQTTNINFSLSSPEPTDSDPDPNSSPPSSVSHSKNSSPYSYTTMVTMLKEDNERLQRSNNMLVSELANLRKLYNDIIYFVQNHVKVVATAPQQPNHALRKSMFNVAEDQSNASGKTKLFGVSLQSKKRIHPDQNVVETGTYKSRLVLAKGDLRLDSRSMS